MSSIASSVPAYKSCADRLSQHICGCLLGGAIGDALGAPVSFMSKPDIFRRYGVNGLQDYAPDCGRPGAITEKTLLAFFITEGLIRTYLRIGPESVNAGPKKLNKEFRIWMHFQPLEFGDKSPGLQSWTIANAQLQRRHHPLSACLQALDACKSFESAPISRGTCDALAMIAPVGMYAATRNRDGGPGRSTHSTFENADVLSNLSPGRLSAAYLASLIEAVLRGDSLEDAIDRSLAELRKHPGHEHVARAIETARELDRLVPNDHDAAQGLGDGEFPHDTLAIGLYYALAATDFESGVLLAVNHGGNFDAIAAVVGNILGAVYGLAAIPDHWLDKLEMKDLVKTLAMDLASLPSWDPVTGRDSYWDRYVTVNDPWDPYQRSTLEEDLATDDN